jgi:hypothetical protein
VLWAYLFYAILNLLSFALGYFLLPQGALLNTPYSALSGVAAQQPSAFLQFLSTVGFNLGAAFLLGAGLNLQRVNGFPTGYVFLFVAGIISGLIAGTNSFVVQAISPYTLEGWVIALRIQHLELLGYAVIAASTVGIGIRDYSSWLPWKAKEVKIQNWRGIRLSRQEVVGIVTGVFMVLLAGYNETILGL